MLVDITVALVIRNKVKLDEFAMRNDLFKVLNDIVCFLRITETTSLGLLAIIHIRIDYPGKNLNNSSSYFLEFYRLVFASFFVCATFHMYFSIMLYLMPRKHEVSKYHIVLITF
jgi:hypothetical protein